MLATTGVLLLILSVLTSYIMWWKRCPSKSAGLPARPARKPGTRSIGTPAITLIGIALATIYPAFGVTLLIVVALDTLARLAMRGRGGPDNEPTDTPEEAAPVTRQ